MMALKKYGFLGKDMYKNVARSYINKEKLEITQLPIYQLENESLMVYMYNGLLHSNKK